MKKMLFALFVLVALGCGSMSSGSKASFSKEPPRVDIYLQENSLPKGLRSISSRKVTALVIYNLPDSYLIKAKSLFNPPDYAAQEVTNLQTDRQAWLEETLVSYCDDCKNFNVDIPFKVLPEKVLLQLIDKASLNQDVTEKDMATLKKYLPGTEVIWILLGSENYEQRRGESADGITISAVAENTVTLRSSIYDLQKAGFLNRTSLNVTDQDVVVYEKVMETDSAPLGKGRVITDKFKNGFWPLPVGRTYDGPRYDETYPYPPVPDSRYLLKRAFTALGESLNP